MGTLRTFIAVHPDPRALHWLSRSVEALRGRHPGIRWVRSEHLHLTLKFLGEIPPERVEEVGRVCDDAASAAEPFHLHFGAPNHFGKRSRPRTFWIGFLPSGGLEALERLQVAVEEALQVLALPREDRPWTPHLTLGRNPRAAQAEGWESLLAPWEGGGPPSMEVNGLNFYSSELTGEGPIHRLLRSEALGGSRAPREGSGR